MLYKWLDLTNVVVWLTVTKNYAVFEPDLACRESHRFLKETKIALGAYVLKMQIGY